MNPQLFPVHDRILGASYWHFGAGADYALTESLDLSFSYVTYLAGTDTHFGRGITIGTTWNFTRHPKLSARAQSLGNRLDNQNLGSNQVATYSHLLE